MTREHLDMILNKHEKWIKGEKGNESADLSKAHLREANLSDADLSKAHLRNADLRKADLREANLSIADLRNADLSDADLCKADLRNADLCKADLRGANLRWANLNEADLDYSCWPLWCGSLDVKVDARIARQLAYHFCRLDCDDPEYLEARRAIAKFANKFHRTKECGRIKA